LKSFHSVNNKITVDFRKFDLPISQSQALKILHQHGFEFLTVDLVSQARQLIGVSKYKLDAPRSAAPSMVNCSSLMEYLFGLRGVELPPLSVYQAACGESMHLEHVGAEDLVFTPHGRNKNLYLENPDTTIGHVGMVTGDDTIIHAIPRQGIVEESTETFLGGKRKKYWARRIIPKDDAIISLSCPENLQIRSQIDIWWLLMRTLPTSNTPLYAPRNLL